MSKPSIHSDYCRCPRCNRRHPAAREIAPSTKAAILAALTMAGWLGVLWVAAALRDLAASWPFI